MVDAPTPEPETFAWWVNPSTFGQKLTEFNTDAKRLGDSALPPAVAAYLQDQETCQARELCGVPPNRSLKTPGLIR
jgi:hypothetical protein